MDNSPRGNYQSTPELTPADLCPPERRSVRRRLVQSTLFPQKSQSQGREENGHGKAERDTCGDGDGDNSGGGGEEDCYGSQRKRKRRPRGKTTPSKKSSEKKGRRSCNTTPKKKLANFLVEEALIVIPDLRLEAKITAEENSRMFAGRQIHPFFISSCKASKKNQELIDLVGKQSVSGRAKKEINCGPIHVLERTQDNDMPLDWKTWTFYEGIFVKSDFFLERLYSSAAEGSVECLSFDKLPITSHLGTISVAGDEVFSEQCRIQEDCVCETVPRTSVVSEDVNTVCCQPMKGIEVNNIVDSSKVTGESQKLDIGQESKFLEERMKSYYFSCVSQPSNSLWTYKYQSKMAVQVCGNDESVKFLSEWLQHWHGRDLQISKDPDCDIGDVQDEDYICSENDSDADNNSGEASLKNVLLVTGPVGSGKSAAIYACAREQ